MHLINGRFYWLMLIAGGLSYVGCSERTDVARNKGGGDAGDGSGAKASAGSLGVAGNDDSAEAGSNGAGGTTAGVGGTSTLVGGAGDAGDATAGAGGAENLYPNACSTLSFAPAVRYDIEQGQMSFRALAAGDLDGDDKPDLVVVNSGGTASFFTNKGDGSFGEPTSIPTGYGATFDVLMFDANGDQKLDLVFLNWSFSVSVSLNQGGGTFGTPDDYIIENDGTALGSVVAGDVTGDSKPDLAVSLWDREGVGILVNKGDGTFKDLVKYPTVDPMMDNISNMGFGLTLADFDGKNGLDVAVGPSGGVLLNNGDGSFATTKHKELQVGPFVVAADLNGDDLPDLVGASGFRANLQNDTFGAPGGFKSFDQGRIVTADMLGRGRLDVVVPGTAFPNNGDGTFGEAVPFDIPMGGPDDRGHAVIAADFNGDDKLDLAVISNTATDGLSVLLNTCTP